MVTAVATLPGEVDGASACSSASKRTLGAAHIGGDSKFSIFRQTFYSFDKKVCRK